MSVQHLSNQEAISKMREIAEDINICMFCTHSAELPFSTRPMATQKVDEQGNIWFLSGKESDKNHEIKNDDMVQLIYAKPGDYKFMTVTGHATVSKDREKIEEMWTPIAKTWFHGGKDDPDLTVICVRPQSAYYWDTKNNKMVSMLKIAAGAITGKTMDDGIEGKLDVDSEPQPGGM
jgi:general stress protein 26